MVFYEDQDYFRSDQGSEFDNRRLRVILDRSGILLETTAPGTPEWNAVSERAGYTIMNRARALLINSGLPLQLWGPCLYLTQLGHRVPRN